MLFVELFCLVCFDLGGLRFCTLICCWDYLLTLFVLFVFCAGVRFDVFGLY